MKPNKNIEFKIRPINEKGQHGMWKKMVSDGSIVPVRRKNNPVILKLIAFIKKVWEKITPA